MTKQLLAVAVVASAIALAAGLKPAQKEAKAKFEEEITEPLKAMNEACGTKATVKTDFENLKTADWEGQSISSRCEAVLSGIGALCGRPAYKEEITKELKTVACLFGGKAGDNNDGTKANMSWKGGTFTFKMHKDNPNITDVAKEVLEKALND